MGREARITGEQRKMGIVTDIVERHDIPHEPGEWMELRRLSAKQLRQVRRARQIDGAEVLRAYGGDLMKAMRNTDADAVAAAQRDPLNDLDHDTLLSLAIVGWSYDMPVAGNVDRLDEPTEQWAVETIARICGITPEDADARKNG